YPTPVHRQPAFLDLGYGSGAFPNAEMQADQTLCLPIRPDLGEDDIAYVCETVRSFHRAHAPR
ncbi:MAG TPA: DegT/DnrJ/EryC1/StrS family aminotransferase, partial [Candidatus Eisenbacteria bacterium]|nr:DegT/DnrJ/EryC1/StrS family aminotransferase [Candidatus Eisenbacteria bacterium]